MKKKSNHSAADTAATAPATRLPRAATATTTATMINATLVFGTPSRNGSSTSDTTSGATSASSSTMRSVPR